MTTVGPVKAALVALLSTSLPATTQVRYGPRGPNIKDDVVSVGGIEGTNDPASLGTQRKTWEVYEIKVIVSCTRRGADNQQLATEAALNLYGVAELAIRSQPNETLGVAGVAWARPLGSFSLDEPAEISGDSYNGTVEFVVQVKAKT